MKTPDLFEDDFLDSSPLPGVVFVIGIMASLFAIGVFIGCILCH